ncbi:Type III helper protein HopAK1 [Pseudomonas caricapapayae]|uniref:Type III helper protein HopAK1 n=2 Tax=Pseudomonas caricapapayae TaxID=46678 RepID=A0A0P9KST0_9PSED|nr:Type III helper protein HopAK1 [Pseudomonas caricapapayae]RMM09107.1 Type III helper protein HopAK1 [Pseudomonas caricapapayae]
MFPCAFHSGTQQLFLSGITNCSFPQAGKSAMNMINRNYYPVSGQPALGSTKAPDGIQPSDVRSGHNSTTVDFSPPHQATGLQSPLNILSSTAQSPTTHTASSTPGATSELLLNKLVEAIRDAIKKLLSGLLGNQPQREASPPAQTQREQPPTSPQSSSAPSTASPSQPSIPSGKAEKPFVVQSDHPADKPVALQKTTDTAPSATSPTTAGVAGRGTSTVEKTPVKAEPGTHAVASEPVLPKTPPTTLDTPDATEKLTAPVSHAAHGQGADMSGILGFAKEADTTGGNKGEVVTVNSVAELKEKMEDDTARTVRLGANLSADSKVTINFGANKTLLGTDKGNTLHNIYLASGKTASNDIFQNLNFSHDARYRNNGDMQMFISSGQKYWIDSNTYTGTKDQNPKGLDKLLYVGGKADLVTLTNSKFQNNEYGVILGQPDDSAAAKAEYKGYPRMTIANNVFSNLDVRAPGLMRHGQFDVFNNAIDDFHLGFTATGDATILSQANYFAKGVDVSNKASNSGVLDDYGDAHFKDIGSNVSFTQKSPVTAWTPSYDRDVKTAEAARAYDLANAGAKSVK